MNAAAIIAKREISRATISMCLSGRIFFGIVVLLFAVSVTATCALSVSMSAIGEMPMPGGWAMSMMWMRVPGQTWLGIAASFLGMWLVMMVAMMLPSLIPALWRYRQVVIREGRICFGRLTALVGASYFFVWIVFGMAVFPLGAALAMVEMRWPALAQMAPVVASGIVVFAGMVQFTAWKVHHLACCRQMPVQYGGLPTDVGTAWQYGLRLGLHCCCCCANLMMILLVLGIMDLRAMAVVTTVITVERLMPAGERVARITGVVAVAAGLFLIAQALGSG